MAVLRPARARRSPRRMVVRSAPSPRAASAPAWADPSPWAMSRLAPPGRGPRSPSSSATSLCRPGSCLCPSCPTATPGSRQDRRPDHPSHRGAAMSDTRYTKDHEYIRIEGDVGTIGITDYAQGQLGDVVFVELPQVGKSIAKGGEAAVVESVKAA